MKEAKSQFSLVSNIKENKLNVFYTLLIFFNNFAYGISVNIIGAVMVDFAIIYNTNLNTISYIQVMVAIGYLTGSFASFLYRYINRQLCLTFFVLLLAVTLVFLPSYGSLLAMFGMMIVNNIGAGAWDSSTSIWLVDMWPVGNAAFLQINQMMYGLGSTIGPFLAAPFVYGDANVTGNNETLTTGHRVHTLMIPFLINGALQSIVPIIFIINFFTCRYEKYDSSKKTPEEENEDDYSDDLPVEEDYSSIPHRKFKLALTSLAASTYITAELGFLSFCASMYQFLEIGLSASTAAQVQSILSVTYTLGRFFTAFISLKLKPDRILAYHYVIILGSIALLIFGRNNITLIYVGNALLGFGLSACWPSMFSFTEHYLRLSDKVCSLYAFLAGLVSMVIPITLAQVFDKYPIILILLCGGFVCLSLVFFIIVRVWIALSKEPTPKFPQDDFYRRYSVAGPRMSMHFTNFKQDRLRRKSMAPDWVRRQSQFQSEDYDRRKSTVSGKKRFARENNDDDSRRKSTAPGF